MGRIGVVVWGAAVMGRVGYAGPFGRPLPSP